MSTKSISEYIKQMRKKHNLTLNSKKSKIKRSDFKIVMSSDGLEEQVIENLFSKFKKVAYK